VVKRIATISEAVSIVGSCRTDGRTDRRTDRPFGSKYRA